MAPELMENEQEVSTTVIATTETKEDEAEAVILIEGTTGIPTRPRSAAVPGGSIRIVVMLAARDARMVTRSGIVTGSSSSPWRNL